jgi:hypothetical protein
VNAPVPESTEPLRDLVIRLQRATLSPAETRAARGPVPAATRFVDTDSSRFELLLSLLLGANRHLGEIDALLPLFSRHPADIV